MALWEKFDFPTVHYFDASHSLQREGHIAINHIVASTVSLHRWLVGSWFATFMNCG